MSYKYTLLKMNGTSQEIGTREKRMSLPEMYKILHCRSLELIPHEYYRGDATMWGDDDGRFKKRNKRNPHFKVLKGDESQGEPTEWDVVGDILKEERI